MLKVTTNELKAVYTSRGEVDHINGYIIVNDAGAADLRLSVQNDEFAHGIHDDAQPVLRQAVVDAGIDLTEVEEWTVAQVGVFALMVPKVVAWTDCPECGGQGSHSARCRCRHE